jgi:hypothetical protein
MVLLADTFDGYSQALIRICQANLPYYIITTTIPMLWAEQGLTVCKVVI